MPLYLPQLLTQTAGARGSEGRLGTQSLGTRVLVPRAGQLPPRAPPPWDGQSRGAPEAPSIRAWPHVGWFGGFTVLQA